ncbi:MAG: DNA gyrase subunit A [Candidatus Cloacimonetes bacterium]|nr:DNA gyrase subunit A [Candidatus Cloacimonadota bacterium]
MSDDKSRMILVEVEEELKKSYLEYSMSVIVARALPDSRDGLKPSQRRILYAMHELNLSPGSHFRKCAKIAGDTSGNYHPHGEQVVYPTLVRLAQPWLMRYLLIDGQGNFGSIDGDPPAAMRYTEARLHKAAVDLMDDLEKETVNYKGNYDETRKEPEVFPSKFPNMLVNGATGIAVGMATSMPPHNIGEVCDALIALVQNPDLEPLQLMEYIKGPDFPTGGYILGKLGIKDYFCTGRGKVRVRAKADIERRADGAELIIVTEIPYQVSKNLLIEKIVELVKDKRVEGIADIKDESGRQGMRLVIVVKRNADATVVLNNLYKYSQLQGTFGVINLALVNNVPKILNIKDLCMEFINYRHDVIVNRTRFLLKNAEERLHVLEGYRIALDNIDEVIETIKKSESTQAANDKLQEKFGLSEIQAKAILDMRLARLTGLEREKIENEYNEIIQTVKSLKEILENRQLRLDIIIAETKEIKAKFNDPRRTQIIADYSGDLSDLDLIPDENVVVTISHEGYAKRITIDSYRTQSRGGRGATGTNLKDDDFVQDIFIASTHDYILFFTNHGRCLWLRVHELPESTKQSKGRALVNLIELEKDEKVKAMITTNSFPETNFVMMVTKKGLIKKTCLQAFSNVRTKGIKAINLLEGDELIDAKITDGESDILIATANGMANRFMESLIRSTGRGTQGVRGIKLREKDCVVSMVVVRRNGTILAISENGYGKRTSAEDYTAKGRNTMGVITLKTTERNGKLVSLMEVIDSDDLMIVTKNGLVIRQNVGALKVQGRNTQGVRLINLLAEDSVHDITCIENEEEKMSEAILESAEKNHSTSSEEVEITDITPDNVEE